MDTTNLPKSRSEARAMGAKYYFTGVPCVHGHVAPRKTKGVCVECMRAEWTVNAVKRAAYLAAYNQSPAGKEAKARYYAKNKEVVIARASARAREDKRRYGAAWAKAHPEEVKALTRSRRRKHRNATPRWLTAEEKKQMRGIYVTAMRKTKETGMAYVVDHIYPLQGKTVCGLHVPWNLQVLSRVENHAKANKMPDEGMALAFAKPLDPSPSGSV